MYTILLVEDEAMELLALKYAVEMNYDNLRILEAGDGNRALELCREYRPELMIVDINIPGITGLDLIQAVNDLKQDTVIVITTAYDKSGYIRRALEMGVIQYLLKPIDVGELKTALDRCLERLHERCRKKEELDFLQQGMETVSSYAEEYLVRDILAGAAPQEVLSSARGWPEDGSLQVCLLCWQPEREADYESFYQICSSCFQPYFSILFSPLEDGALVFLQSDRIREETALRFLLLIYGTELLVKLEHGKIAGTSFFSEYGELPRAWEELKKQMQTQKQPLVLPGLPMQVLGSSHRRVLIRQKMLQRIREGQMASLMTLFRKLTAEPEGYWPGAALLLEALARYDETFHPAELAELFFSENAMELLGEWLEQYACTRQTPDGAQGGSTSHVQLALELIHTHFQEDLTLTGIAEELGLSAPYFSNLFKQETGKNFVVFLNEERIAHAVQFMEQGETNMEKIAESCGYYSRKYFFEAFKRVKGVSVTQYLQGERFGGDKL